MYTVYVHKNLKNEKYYVGMTSKEPKERWRYGRGYQNQPKMWKDIQESNWNKDWVHGILGKFENEQDALKYESFLIAMLGSIENGYNTSSFDNYNFKRTEEHRKKISEALTGENNPMFGKPFTEEHKKKLSEAHTGKHLTEGHKKKISESLSGEKNPFYGKHHTEESKKKLSEALTGENNPWYGKHHTEESKNKISQSRGVNGILQFSKSGEFIAEYSSIREAEHKTGCHNSSICECCKGKRKSCGGYIWKYKE